MQSTHNIIRSKQSVNVVKRRSLTPPSLTCFINSRGNPFQFPSRTLQTKCVSCSFVTIFRHCTRACNHAQSSRARESLIQLAPKQHDHAEQISNPVCGQPGLSKSFGLQVSVPLLASPPWCIAFLLSPNLHQVYIIIRSKSKKRTKYV